MPRKVAKLGNLGQDKTSQEMVTYNFVGANDSCEDDDNNGHPRGILIALLEWQLDIQNLKRDYVEVGGEGIMN